MIVKQKLCIALSIVLSLSFLNGYSQVLDNLSRGTKSRVEFKKNSKIKGEVYIYNEWNKGMIVLNDSVFSKQDNLQYNVVENKILIKKDRTDTVIEISDRSLTGFAIIEPNNIKHDFVWLKKGEFTDFVEEGFFEVVYNLDNKNYLIKKTIKEIYDPNRSKGTQAINNFPLEYRNKVTYFIKNSSSKYVQIKLRKKDIKKVLSENTEAVNGFIKKNKINFSKESHIVKLANFYYSL